MQSDPIPSQKTLSHGQIEEFYHDNFVEEQWRDFDQLVAEGPEGVVVDIGGGCGFFARAVSSRSGRSVRVIDSDPVSIAKCAENGVPGIIGDALRPREQGDEGVICFNLMLHHLVGADENATRALQLQALRAWHGEGRRIFVNEYIYESFVGNASGRLIFAITSSAFLSRVGRIAARFVKSLEANTFGIGVRFRAHDEWKDLFAEAGYRVADCRIGRPEDVALPLRGLLIKDIRRDSFLLEPATA
jgi:hypothetical protein